MSAFNRDKAREVLWPERSHEVYQSEDEVLDALAACVVDSPHALDRAALHRIIEDEIGPVLRYDPHKVDLFFNRLIDRILALVKPVTINRDALIDELEWGAQQYDFPVESTADRILALVQPADGVVLTLDPRISQIKAWIDDVDDGGPVFLDRLKKILDIP